MIGEKFGRLTVIGASGHSNSGKRMWDCVCDCGNHARVTTSDLRNGHTRSCGCIRKEELVSRSTSHGRVNSRLYSIWTGMKSRCYNPKQDNYKYYGGRGIFVCEEWLNDFQAFYTWAVSHGYREGYTIDRINVDGAYAPDNCAWKTQKEQNLNTRNSRFIEYGGKRQTVREWADALSLPYPCLLWRLDHGWDVDRAFMTPSRRSV